MNNNSITAKWFRSLILAAAMISLLSFASGAGAVSLKQNSIVTDNVIRLGDIFHGLPENEDRVLGVAPRPGQDMTLNARTLMRIAIALDLPWRPSSNADYIVLKRSATVIDRDMIESALRASLEQEGVNGKYNVKLPAQVQEIILPDDLPAQVEIDQIRYRPDKGFFEAVLVAPSSENPVRRIEMTGSVETLVEVPVLRQTLRNGTVIGKHDIEYLDIRARDLKHDIILDAGELDGMTPRRMVMQGRPVNVNDIEAPLSVERGDQIVMIFKEGPLTLTAAGKALENGARGDMIRVVNRSSNKTIEAVVSGSREVTVKNF